MKFSAPAIRIHFTRTSNIILPMSDKVTFLTGYWKNATHGTNVCVKELFDNIRSRGYEIEVSSLGLSARDVDGYDDDVKIYYSRDRFVEKLYYRAKLASSAILKKTLITIGVIINYFCRLVYAFNYPISSHSVYKRWANKTISSLSAERRCRHYLVSVIEPFPSLYTGYLVKRKLKDVIWIVYYIDNGTNVLAESKFESLKKKLQSIAQRKENDYLSIADKIVVMEGHSEYYKNHLNKLNVGKLCYANIPLLKPYPQCLTGNKRQDSFLKFVYVGSIYGVYYDPRKVCDFFVEFHKKHTSAVLELYGPTDHVQYLDAMTREHPYIQYKGIVEHSNTVDILSKADVLLYYLTVKVDSVSGKLFDYLSYEKPILYIGNKDDINFNYLSKYSLGLGLDILQTPHELAEEASTFLEQSRNKVLSYDDIKRDFYLNLPETTVNLFFGE